MNRLFLILAATSALGAVLVMGCGSDDSASSEQAASGGSGGTGTDASTGGHATQSGGSGGGEEQDASSGGMGGSAGNEDPDASTGGIESGGSAGHDEIDASTGGTQTGGSAGSEDPDASTGGDGDDACADVTCPPNATCVVKDSAGFCECDEGMHLDDDLCCEANASNVGGTCTCDAGYHDESGTCVADSTNQCAEDNLCAEPHRNVCVPDGSAEGYHCDCNENYVPAIGGSGCRLAAVTDCGTGFVCEYNFCVSEDLSQDQCVTDSDCHEFTSIALCNPAAAGGICLGCQDDLDCPGNLECTEYNTCASTCDTNDDCPYGVCHGSGYCAQKKCTSNSDCFPGTICNNEDNDPDGGMCQRPPCSTTQCSSSNPDGDCPNADESCIDGACVSSCSPNPCNEINQTECSIVGGKPTCSCAPGTSLNSDGMCAPIPVSDCPDGFTCESGRCVDDSVTGFQCGSSSDCGVPMNCSNALPSGICFGCEAGFDCPDGTTCVSDFCLADCLSESDCAPGMLCNGGYCGKTDCISPTDCPADHTCSATGRCERLPCE